MDVSTEDLYSGSYFSVENELSYITNSGRNFAQHKSTKLSSTSGKHKSMNRGNKTMDLSRQQENNSAINFDDHSGDLWRILMES